MSQSHANVRTQVTCTNCKYDCMIEGDHRENIDYCPRCGTDDAKQLNTYPVADDQEVLSQMKENRQ